MRVWSAFATWILLQFERVRMLWWQYRTAALLRDGAEAEAEERARNLSRNVWCLVQLQALARFWLLWSEKKNSEQVSRCASLVLATELSPRISGDKQPRAYARALGSTGQWVRAAETFRAVGWKAHAARAYVSGESWDSAAVLLDEIAKREEASRRPWLAAAARKASSEALERANKANDALIEAEHAANLAMETLRDRAGAQHTGAMLPLLRWGTQKLRSAEKGSSFTAALVALANRYAAEGHASEAAVLYEEASFFAQTHATSYRPLLRRRAGEQWIVSAEQLLKAGKVEAANELFATAATFLSDPGAADRLAYAQKNAGSRQGIRFQELDQWWDLLSDEAGREPLELLGDALLWLENFQEKALALQASVDAAREDRALQSYLTSLERLGKGPAERLLRGVFDRTEVSVRLAALQATKQLPYFSKRAFARAATDDGDERVRREGRILLLAVPSSTEEGSAIE